MNEIRVIFYSNKLLAAISIITIILNGLLSSCLINIFSLKFNKYINEARGRRLVENSFYKKCANTVMRYFSEYERRYGKTGIYIWLKTTAGRAGFKGRYSVLKYLSLQAALPLLVFVTAFLLNFPSLDEALKALAIVFITVWIVIARKSKRLDMALQRNGYKIYKYLHNQISSGVKVTDALKTVYEVVEDRNLKDALLRMAARYELTFDIDASLNEFKSVYNSYEGESFCVAIKQGILTGDNQGLLARQEEIMFKKYFSYIQAETDACRMRSIIAAVVFTAIIVIMILIPLFFQAGNAIEQIFIN